jgi:hypothetical protein
MPRIINTANPGKLRNQERRTIAEILRHLMGKPSLDQEARDMAAAIVFSLRAIDATIDITTEAWEKRNYYLKADRFRLEWEWVRPAAERLEALIRKGAWEQLPEEMVGLMPYFSDVSIAKFTRKPEAWHASYQLLLQED